MNTEPKIHAEFVLDEHGKPVERNGNYAITLTVQDAPVGASKVLYQLDSTYYDPLREARDAPGNFAENITSYGEYVVQAKVRTTDHAIAIARSLADALSETYEGSNDPAILKALRDIREN